MVPRRESARRPPKVWVLGPHRRGVGVDEVCPRELALPRFAAVLEGEREGEREGEGERERERERERESEREREPYSLFGYIHLCLRASAHLCAAYM